jgi:cyanophycinase-like exopeptidase
MQSGNGKIVIMGSGELTATMVEVHKSLLASGTGVPKATFLDTPAGFQLNVDQISQKAVEYFRARIQQPLTVASFKSNEQASDFEAEQAFHILRESDYVLIGPGSPTYAVRQWMDSPVPEILTQRIKSGGCLVAASAAALTVGRFTIPVYEIYKVGQDVHWVDGMNILGQFGFNLVVVPHWNNAEGGTHDTRFCFMGAPRFRRLQALLPDDISVFGLDEHTACILDLVSNQAQIKGIGRAILRRSDGELIFETGDRFPLDILRGTNVSGDWKPITPETGSSENNSGRKENAFWDRINSLEENFRNGLQHQNPNQSTNALLELDRTIWQAHQDIENEEFITQARDTLRELVVLLGNRLTGSPGDKSTYLAPLVEALLELRQQFREKKQWQDADAIRDSLQKANILIEDTPNGSRWQMKT